MSDILIIDDEDLNFVWEIIQKQQMIFHPQIAPEGNLTFENFSPAKRKSHLFFS